MYSYYEIDFLEVETRKSGDAIALRYGNALFDVIHVVDGGFQSTGPRLVDHINNYYSRPILIDHVVVTHQDGDHTKGLVDVLNSFHVGRLWMIRPWLYSSLLINFFTRFHSERNLSAHLRDLYPNLVELEEAAIARGVTIEAPFQGAQIGAFRVLAPSARRYLQLILSSDRTPALPSMLAPSPRVASSIFGAGAVPRQTTSPWGIERFSDEESSAENEMSIVQFAGIAGHRILLTGDAGRGALTEAIAYGNQIGLGFPGVDVFQVPHHGSRRNVSTEILDALLGVRLQHRPSAPLFSAFISSARADPDHPRHAVIRAMVHRGANVFTTEGASIRRSHNAPSRGWHAAVPMEYPSTQEE